MGASDTRFEARDKHKNEIKKKNFEKDINMDHVTWYSSSCLKRLNK